MPVTAVHDARTTGSSLYVVSLHLEIDELDDPSPSPHPESTLISSQNRW